MFKSIMSWFSPSKIKKQAEEVAKVATVVGAEGSFSSMEKKASEAVKHTKASLNKLTKVQLEDLARKEWDHELDRRLKKSDLVDQVLKLTKK